MSKNAKIPAHVAIIMDGNGRWARQRGMERIQGHAIGVESVRASLKAAMRNGVRVLTLYAFSTENWGRPKQEVDTLMELFCQSVINETSELIRQGVCVQMIGSRTELSPKVNAHLDRIEKETASGDRLTLLLAINYSARSELAHAIHDLARRVAKDDLRPEDISEATIAGALYTAGLPDPDLIIRTGGEQRLSNFLLWQGAYAELYFTQTLWPDFREADFDRAVTAYAERSRRFGLLNEPEIDENQN